MANLDCHQLKIYRFNLAKYIWSALTKEALIGKDLMETTNMKHTNTDKLANELVHHL